MVQSLGYPNVGQRSRSEDVTFMLNRDLRPTSHSSLPQFLEYHRSIRQLMPQNRLIFAYHIFYLWLHTMTLSWSLAILIIL
jgi:hypothetical protein